MFGTFYPMPSTARPSGSTTGVAASTTAPASSSTTGDATRERHTRAILVGGAIITGLTLGVYVGKGEV